MLGSVAGTLVHGGRPGIPACAAAGRHRGPRGRSTSRSGSRSRPRCSRRVALRRLARARQAAGPLAGRADREPSARASAPASASTRRRSLRCAIDGGAPDRAACCSAAGVGRAQPAAASDRLMRLPARSTSATSRSSPTSTTASRRWPTASSRSPAPSTPRKHRAAAARHDGARARARHHDQGPGRARGVQGPRRPDLPPAPDRHAGPRRLHLRGVALAGRLRRRAAGRGRLPGRRGADARQHLPGGRRRPRADPGAQQDRPARRRARARGGRDPRAARRGPAEDILRISAKTGRGREELLEAIVAAHPAARRRRRRARRAR